jgi:hypothetical protein
MRTDKQNESSRRNGAKSRGPVTDAGKQRSSANAAKHYITSRALLIPGESSDELDRHFAAYCARFRPVDGVELDLVENLAFVAWRQRRLSRREADLITEGTACSSQAGLDTQRRAASASWEKLAQYAAMPLLHREDVNLRRAYDRILKTLLLLQQTRPDSPSSEPDPPSPTELQNEPEPDLSPSDSNILEASPNNAATPQPPSENGIRSVSPRPRGFAASGMPERMANNRDISTFYDETLLH